MNNRTRLLRCLGVAASVVMCASAFAQSGSTARLLCHSIGNSPAEPLGDRDGHAVAVGQFTCRTEGGSLDGGLLTGVTIWEYDKTNAVSLSGNGLTRKPGAYAAYEQTEGKLALTLSDGKVTGFTGMGRGRYTLATGAAAALTGKSYSFTFRSTGPGQFVVDVKVE
jgi:hypothetical protein